MKLNFGKHMSDKNATACASRFEYEQSKANALQVSGDYLIEETESILGEEYHIVEFRFRLAYSDWCQFSKSLLYQSLLKYLKKLKKNNRPALRM